jgi:prevent-host-death family protein
MQSIRSRDFKNSFERYLLAVRRGKTLLITDRGKPVAKVSPPDEGDSAGLTFSEVLEKLEAEGKIRLGKKPLRRFKAIPSRGKSSSQMIIEDRG